MEGGREIRAPGIPSWLNPIRTRPDAAPGSNDDHSSCSPSPSPSPGDDHSPAATPNCPTAATPDSGYTRGRIANWFSSYFSPRSSDHKANHCFPSTSEANRLATKHQSDCTKLHKKGFKGKQPSTGSHSQSPYMPSPLKSFSCELGSKVCIQRQPSLRSRSSGDLKVFLSSYRMNYDDAKDKVNSDLISIANDLKDAIDNGLLSEAGSTAQELLNLSKQCGQMIPCEFQEVCEKIVCDLAERNDQPWSSLLENFQMRLLMVLTHCTRLLHYGEENWKVDDEQCQRCLQSVPSYEMKWVSASDAEASVCSTDSLATEEETKSISSATPKEQIVLHNLLIDSPQNPTKDQSVPTDEWAQNTVMCRICEESVQTSHLESHSYVCAYANECDLEGLTIDDRLHKIADMLEQILDSCNHSFEQLCGQSIDSSVKSGHESPQVQEWHNKG